MASENIQEDFLEVDQKIPGQNFVCLSFISPESVIKDKQRYFQSHFFKYVFHSGDKTIQEKLQNENLGYEDLNSIYEDWLYTRQESLEQEFYEKNDFRTSVRGVKIRGVYETVKEANIRAKILQKRDPSFNVFVGQVGYWLPWDPESDKIENQEYQEQHLNELVKNYKQNLEQRDEYYEQVKQDKIKKAKEELARQKQELEKEKPANENTPDTTVSEKKINELRDIMDTRDQALAEIEAQKKNSTLDNEQNEEVLNTENDETIQQSHNTQQNSMEKELEEEDPWMKRNNNEETSEVAELS